MHKPRSLLRTVGAISSATSLSRVLGLVRDQVQSYYFGAGPITDAFIAAFRVPNLLRDLFAEGAFSSAFVPTFTAERERMGDEAAWRLANRVIAAMVLVLGVVTVLIATGAPWILGVYVPGFTPEKMALTVTMTRIVSPFLLFVALAALVMGVLNTFGRFFVPALSPALVQRGSHRGCGAAGPLCFPEQGSSRVWRWPSARWSAACSRSWSSCPRCTASVSASGRSSCWEIRECGGSRD